MGLFIGIDSQQMEFSGDVVVIGSSPSSHLFLTDPRLQERHAVLRSVAGRWLIEAQGNATIRVGDGGPTKVAWLNSGDVISLTDSGPTLTFAPVKNGAITSMPVNSPAAQSRVVPTETASPIATDAKLVIKLPFVVWAIGGSFVALFAFAVVILAWPKSSNISLNSTPNPAVANSSAEDSQSTGKDTLNPKLNDRGLTEKQTQLPSSAAIYQVILTDLKTERSSRIGTAWAVTSRTLVTTGIIGKMILDGIANDFRAVIRGEGRHTPLVIERVSFDPDFLSVSEELLAAGTELDDLWEQWDHAQDDSKREKLSPLMDAANTRYLKACQRQISRNLAALEVAQELPATLRTIDAESTKLRPGSSVRLLGFPILSQDLLVDPEESQAPVSRDGKIDANDAAHQRWRVRISSPPLQNYWFGSPVMNASEQVIGSYSLATPPVEPTQNYVPATHEVTSLERLPIILQKNSQKHR